jgi:putative lipoprotein
MIGSVAVPALLLSASVALSDPWIGIDKVKHFFMTAFVQSISYSTLRLTNSDHRSSMIGASAVSAGFGIGKEIFDRRRGGVFSTRDLVWDAAGATSAAALLSQTRR